MTDKKDHYFSDVCDAQALQIAFSAFKRLQNKPISELERLSRAITAYALAVTFKTQHVYKYRKISPDPPIEMQYPIIEDRYIALNERNRATTIISDNFDELDWEGSIDIDEIKLFLAMVYDEIKGN